MRIRAYVPEGPRRERVITSPSTMSVFGDTEKLLLITLVFGVAVARGVRVGVGVGVIVGVLVAVRVGVAVGVMVGVFVGVDVRVGVGVAVGVAVSGGRTGGPGVGVAFGSMMVPMQYNRRALRQEAAVPVCTQPAVVVLVVPIPGLVPELEVQSEQRFGSRADPV